MLITRFQRPNHWTLSVGVSGSLILRCPLQELNPPGTSEPFSSCSPPLTFPMTITTQFAKHGTKGRTTALSIEDFVAMCERVMRRAAQDNPDTPCLQNVFAQGTENTGHKGEIVSRVKPTILLVEDEPAMLDALQEILQQQNYTVLMAPSGEFAIRICQEYSGTIDVLVCDMVLGGVDGCEVAARVKSVFPNVVVLAMSGTPLESFPKGIVADQFFAKPFGHEELLAAIARHIQSR